MDKIYFRGVKAMLPAKEDFAEFKKFIDIMAHFKLNTLMLEIGGAMEYKSHPEINEGWVKYAAFMNEYPGKTHETNNKCKWYKNSIHSENGGGGVLSQDDVRELIGYAASRGIEVVPEVPSLSHSDYILYSHRELAEIPDDPFPDTCCPSNEGTYAILFDILDEVIGVFRPRLLNIGHDEFYSIGVCEKCNGRKAEEIYAADICRIHDFLASKGVRTMMWGEKLLKFNFIDSGAPWGGSAHGCCPATYKAIDLIPRDILILHWYWALDRKLEAEYFSRGFDFAFGNYSGRSIPDFRGRAQAKGFSGYILSNWGRSDMLTLQRNGVLADIVFNKLVEESADPDADKDAIWNEMFRILFRLRYSDGANYAFIRHSTAAVREFKYFCDGTYINREEWRLGDYRVTLDSGEVLTVPVIYGENISRADQNWNPGRMYDADAAEARESLAEVAYTAFPVRDGERTSYIFGFEIPAGSAVRAIEFVPAAQCGGEDVSFELCPDAAAAISASAPGDGRGPDSRRTAVLS